MPSALSLSRTVLSSGGAVQIKDLQLPLGGAGAPSFGYDEHNLRERQFAAIVNNNKFYNDFAPIG